MNKKLLQSLTEKAIRAQVQRLLNETVKMPISLDQGHKFFNDMKAIAVHGNDDKALTNVVRLAIRQLKQGDRADQKFADNLRAFQGSIRSGHSKWVIVELAYAEWRNRRLANPVEQTTPVTSESKTAKKTLTERVGNHSAYVNWLSSQVTKSGKKEHHPELLKLARKIDALNSSVNFTDDWMSQDGRKELSTQFRDIAKQDYGTAPELYESVSKPTRLEKIYETIVDFASQNGREPFDVLDDMMAVAEKEVQPEQLCEPESITLDNNWGFEHNGVRVNNPLYDPAGKEEVDPPTFYGDNFMNSTFPFAHGDHFIVDPRYNETGDIEVNPEEYYGDAFKSSAYFNVFNKKK